MPTRRTKQCNRLNVLLDDETLAEIRSHAASLGLGLSAYMRLAALAYIRASKERCVEPTQPRLTDGQSSDKW